VRYLFSWPAPTRCGSKVLEHKNVVYGETAACNGWGSTFPIQVFYGNMQSQAAKHVKDRRVLLSLA